MGLLPSIIIGALLIVAFAHTSQQRLAIASHTGPMPARQIAYLMRAHHQAAIALKQATPSLTALIDAPPPTMSIHDFVFLSCISSKAVVTVLETITANGGVDPAPIPRLMVGTAEANAILKELAHQVVLSPELGRLERASLAMAFDSGNTALVTPAPGVGLLDGPNIDTQTGKIPMPAGCPIAIGAPAIFTQVLP